MAPLPISSKTLAISLTISPGTLPIGLGNFWKMRITSMRISKTFSGSSVMILGFSPLWSCSMNSLAASASFSKASMMRHGMHETTLTMFLSLDRKRP